MTEKSNNDKKAQQTLSAGFQGKTKRVGLDVPVHGGNHELIGLLLEACPNHILPQGEPSRLKDPVHRGSDEVIKLLLKADLNKGLKPPKT